jgi:hypothetical protein
MLLNCTLNIDGAHKFTVNGPIQKVRQSVRDGTRGVDRAALGEQ